MSLSSARLEQAVFLKLFPVESSPKCSNFQDTLNTAGLSSEGSGSPRPTTPRSSTLSSTDAGERHQRRKSAGWRNFFSGRTTTA